jgi:ribonuclease HI
MNDRKTWTDSYSFIDSLFDNYDHDWIKNEFEKTNSLIYRDNQALNSEKSSSRMYEWLKKAIESNRKKVDYILKKAKDKGFDIYD